MYPFCWKSVGVTPCLCHISCTPAMAPCLLCLLLCSFSFFFCYENHSKNQVWSFEGPFCVLDLSLWVRKSFVYVVWSTRSGYNAIVRLITSKSCLGTEGGWRRCMINLLKNRSLVFFVVCCENHFHERMIVGCWIIFSWFYKEVTSMAFVVRWVWLFQKRIIIADKHACMISLWPLISSYC